MIHNTQSAQISQKQDGRNIFIYIEREREKERDTHTQNVKYIKKMG